jgi:hypothetical protein
MRKLSAFTAIVLLPMCAAAAVTVVYDGKSTAIEKTLPDADRLWLTLPDLTAASGFILKPQGACLDEMCVPIPKARKAAFLRKEHGVEWFNLSELAATLHQPALHDAQQEVWLFGAKPDSQMKFVNTLEAPNFTLTDWKGTKRSLSDFRGKKVFLITWASW